MNELNGNPYLNVQQCEQFAYPPPPDMEEVKSQSTINNKSNSYQVNNNYDLPRSMFENGHQFWNSTSGSCGIAMYNENGYHRVSLCSNSLWLAFGLWLINYFLYFAVTDWLN